MFPVQLLTIELIIDVGPQLIAAPRVRPAANSQRSLAAHVRRARQRNRTTQDREPRASTVFTCALEGKTLAPERQQGESG